MANCDEEPCKSLREAYRQKAVQAAERSFTTFLSCQTYKITRRQLRDAFLLWLVLFALAVACSQFGLLTERLCQVIWALTMLVSAWLGMLYLATMLFAAQLRSRQWDCQEALGEETLARIDLTIGCPPECYPVFLDYKCSCD